MKLTLFMNFLRTMCVILLIGSFAMMFFPEKNISMISGVIFMPLFLITLFIGYVAQHIDAKDVYNLSGDC